MNNIVIRDYKKTDLPYLYEICLLTGKSGEDATPLFKDYKLIGHYSAAPYAIYEPELVCIASLNNIPCGYIIGTKNSKEFYNRCEIDWFPELRKQYCLPAENDLSKDAHFIRMIHKGYVLKEEIKDYPAHLHIDLLPNCQGKGLGKKLMFAFIDKLKQNKVKSLHLEVGKANPNAIAFYEKMGFHEIKEYEYSIAYGINLRE